MHHIHIGAWSTQVTQISFEVRHLPDGLHLSQDALLGTAHDELTLMSTDGAEGTSSEASSMHADAEFDHLVGRNAFSLIFWMWQSGVWKVEAVVQFLLCEGRVGRVYHHPLPVGLLQ